MGSGRIDAYLRSLPAGWESFPECEAKGWLLFGMREMGGHTLELPPQLEVRLSQGALPVTAWLPEVELVAMLLAVHDARVVTPGDEQALWEEIRAENVALFERPEYRALIIRGAPMKLLRHVGSRWNRFHRGTELELIEASDRAAVLDLSYPEGLFPIEALRMRTASLRGVLDACEVRDPAATVEEIAPGKARYSLRWGAIA